MMYYTSRDRSNKVIINVYYMYSNITVFVNVRNATSYAIGKLIASSSNGLLYRTGFFLVIELQLYCDHSCFLQSELFIFLFVLPNIHSSQNIACWVDLVMLLEMFYPCLF